MGRNFIYQHRHLTMDKITGKSSIRPELSAIYFTPDKMVATDSFRLIEVKKAIDIKEPRIIKAKGFKGRGTVTIGDDDIINDHGKLIQGERVDAEYPDYEKAAFDNGEPKFSIMLNISIWPSLPPRLQRNHARLSTKPGTTFTTKTNHSSSLPTGALSKSAPLSCR